MNFLPEKLPETGDYDCTWGKQGEVASRLGLKDVGQWQLRDIMQDQYLFDPNSIFHELPMEDRCGMLLLLDDGWDVPLHKDVPSADQLPEGVKPRPFGNVDLLPTKFPGYGDTPVERLKTLVRKVSELGYCGTGLWIPTETAYEKPGMTLREAKAYWEERAARCQEAGIRYWKIDWGKHANDSDYREMMTEVLRRVAPDIQIEHEYRPFAVVSNKERTPEALERTRRDLQNCDFFRLMDITPDLWHSLGPQRAHEALTQATTPNYETKGIINGEDCYILSAAMGFTTGVLWTRFDETRIPLLWHRVAPPFSVYEAPYKYSEEINVNSRFYDDPHDWRYQKEIVISHPAMMARGCELPKVEPCQHLMPTVCASRNPRTGVSSIAMLPRLVDPVGNIPAMSRVTFGVGTPDKLVGLFGYYRTMTLCYEAEIPSDAHIMAQNIFDTEAVDITESVTVEGNRLILDGNFMRTLWNQSGASKGMISQMIGIV